MTTTDVLKTKWLPVDSSRVYSKVLCLGNNTSDTDTLTRKLAAESDSQCHGLLSELEEPVLSNDYHAAGYYHSSVYDMEIVRLIDISNDFDMIIMLAQPLTQWSHPDAFLNTVRILKSVRVPTTFLDISFASSINYFESLVNTNPSLCIFPFIELLVDRGNTKVCCRSDQPVTTIENLTDFAMDPHYQAIRQKMLAGQRVPEHCASCYALENLGITSARQQETVEWANRLNFSTVEDFSAVAKPIYYEVRASNKCNLQCRMCSPNDSHLIDREYRQIGLIDRVKTPAKKFGGGFDIVEFENLKKLYIAGGEPLVMSETYDFLSRCIQEGRTDFEILINTNGTKLSAKFKQLLTHFSNVQFIFSIDGHGDLNHYIRWPSNWNVILENWQYLRDQGHKVIVNTTVSIYNIHRLHEIYQFVDDRFPGTLCHCQLVQSPFYLSPWLFPDRALVLQSLAVVQGLPCYHNDALFASCIDGCFEFFNSGKTYGLATLTEFFQFNDRLDQSRSIQLRDHDSVLDSWRQHS